jgi:hypothetical protein
MSDNPIANVIILFLLTYAIAGYIYVNYIGR